MYSEHSCQEMYTEHKHTHLNILLTTKLDVNVDVWRNCLLYFLLFIVITILIVIATAATAVVVMWPTNRYFKWREGYRPCGRPVLPVKHGLEWQMFRREMTQLPKVNSLFGRLINAYIYTHLYIRCILSTHKCICKLSTHSHTPEYPDYTHTHPYIRCTVSTRTCRCSLSTNTHTRIWYAANNRAGCKCGCLQKLLIIAV